MKFHEILMWSGVEKYLIARQKPKEFFSGREKIYDLLKKSKIGYITLRKISNNVGYMNKGESITGVTANFGEGLSVYVSNLTKWFMTSVIQNIDWKNSKFTTMNSEYEFIFDEIDDETLNILMNNLNESTSN